MDQDRIFRSVASSSRKVRKCRKRAEARDLLKKCVDVLERRWRARRVCRSMLEAVVRPKSYGLRPGKGPPWFRRSLLDKYHIDQRNIAG